MARSWDYAIHVGCVLLSQAYDVRRILEPNGMSTERPELDEHFDEGRFPWRTASHYVHRREGRNSGARITQIPRR